MPGSKPGCQRHGARGRPSGKLHQILHSTGNHNEIQLKIHLRSGFPSLKRMVCPAAKIRFKYLSNPQAMK